LKKSGLAIGESGPRRGDRRQIDTLKLEIRNLKRLSTFAEGFTHLRLTLESAFRLITLRISAREARFRPQITRIWHYVRLRTPTFDGGQTVETARKEILAMPLANLLTVAGIVFLFVSVREILVAR
jgi:hypothetical protein